MAKVNRNTSQTQQKKKAEQAVSSLSLIHPAAAGIDIGQTLHAVAVPPGSVPEGEAPVRSFGAMTCDLQEIGAWLKACGVETVAMESTGVYWKPLFSLLTRMGFEVYLVNARNVKNVSGRKTDESDAAWLQKLHSCGLLSSSYLPADEQEALRTLVRFRKTLLQDASRCILRMQKSLELMNVKLHTVISDIVGQTGMAIVEAIIAGERNGEAFLPLVNPRIKAHSDTIVKSLQGSWREEHLFTLAQSCTLYKFYKERIAACDTQIETQLKMYEALRNEGVVETGPKDTVERQNRKTKYKNHPPLQYPRLPAPDIGRGRAGHPRAERRRGIADTGGDGNGHEQMAYGKAFCKLAELVPEQ